MPVARNATWPRAMETAWLICKVICTVCPASASPDAETATPLTVNGVPTCNPSGRLGDAAKSTAFPFALAMVAPLVLTPATARLTAWSAAPTV